MNQSTGGKARRGGRAAASVVAAGFLLAAAAGCSDVKSTSPSTEYGRESAAATRQAAADKATPAGAVKHVVIAWLKTPGDKAARQKVIDSAATLRTIPGVLDVAAGECLPSERKVVDSSYDVAMVTTFADEQALKDFGPHPVHQQVLADVIKPNVERYVVYDFVAR